MKSMAETPQSRWASRGKLIILLSALNLSSYADSNELDNFLANSKTMRANFSQTIISGKKSHTTLGKMEISRPNKFRWEYSQDKQLIISDAKKVYIYD